LIAIFGHAEFLELICRDEVNVRQQRLMERRTKAADFHGLKTLEDFDWSFNPAIHRKDIFDLAGEHLFEVIMRRYENRSTIMTSNRLPEDWHITLGGIPLFCQKSLFPQCFQIIGKFRFAQGCYPLLLPVTDLAPLGREYSPWYSRLICW
jgi:DNA replication protein DnaC